jgi:hypothetical protein
MEAARKLPEPDLLEGIARSAGREREALVALLEQLAEVDRRRLHLDLGFPSLYAYCVGALRHAEYSAGNRVEAARAARRFPSILRRLRDGELNLGTLRLLAPHLEQDNHEALLDAARGKTRREVEALVASLSPVPDVPLRLQGLPSVTGQGEPRPGVAPLAPERYRVQFTVGQETNDKLRRAQDLLRREIPTGDPGVIFDRALTLLLDDVARRKQAETEHPRTPRPSDPDSRHVPAHVRREVWRRDGGRCAFVADGGRRCEARSYLELHHLEPFGHGGPTTVENLALRCRAHNAREAERVFGP